MSILRESVVEKELRLAVEAAGGLCYKWISPGNNGVPDRIVILPGGQVSFVELKTKAGKLAPIQKAQLRAIAKVAPMHVYVLYGITGVVSFLRTQHLNDHAMRIEEKYPNERCGYCVSMITM